jgi:hypothetical protein
LAGGGVMAGGSMPMTEQGNSRRRRYWLWLACFLLLVGASFLTLLFFGLKRDRGHECFDRIQVGMPYKEVEPLMDEYGFRLLGEGGVNSGEAMVFQQDKEGVLIVITIFWDGLVTSKYLQEGGAKRNFIERLFRHLAGEKKG